MATYGFTDAQAEAIVMLQLYRLTNTDIVELKNEHAELSERIKEYRHILDNHDALLTVIKNELKIFVSVLKLKDCLQLKQKLQKLKSIKK